MVEVHRDDLDLAEVVVVQGVAELSRPQALRRAAHTLGEVPDDARLEHLPEVVGELHQHVRRAARVLVLAERVFQPEPVLAVALLGLEAVLDDPPEPSPAGDLHRAPCAVDVEVGDELPVVRPRVVGRFQLAALHDVGDVVAERHRVRPPDAADHGPALVAAVPDHRAPLVPVEAHERLRLLEHGGGTPLLEHEHVVPAVLPAGVHPLLAGVERIPHEDHAPAPEDPPEPLRHEVERLELAVLLLGVVPPRLDRDDRDGQRPLPRGYHLRLERHAVAPVPGKPGSPPLVDLGRVQDHDEAAAEERLLQQLRLDERPEHLREEDVEIAHLHLLQPVEHQLRAGGRLLLAVDPVGLLRQQHDVRAVRRVVPVAVHLVPRRPPAEEPQHDRPEERRVVVEGVRLVPQLQREREQPVYPGQDRVYPAEELLGRVPPAGVLPRPPPGTPFQLPLRLFRLLGLPAAFRPAPAAPFPELFLVPAPLPVVAAISSARSLRVHSLISSMSDFSSLQFSAYLRTSASIDTGTYRHRVFPSTLSVSV